MSTDVQYTYIGPSNGKWSDPTNWDQNQVPGTESTSNCSVIILKESLIIITENLQLDNLTIGGFPTISGNISPNPTIYVRNSVIVTGSVSFNNLDFNYYSFSITNQENTPDQGVFFNNVNFSCHDSGDSLPEFTITNEAPETNEASDLFPVNLTSCVLTEFNAFTLSQNVKLQLDGTSISGPIEFNTSDTNWGPPCSPKSSTPQVQITPEKPLDNTLGGLTFSNIAAQIIFATNDNAAQNYQIFLQNSALSLTSLPGIEQQTIHDITSDSTSLLEINLSSESNENNSSLNIANAFEFTGYLCFNFGAQPSSDYTPLTYTGGIETLVNPIGISTSSASEVYGAFNLIPWGNTTPGKIVFSPCVKGEAGCSSPACCQT